MLKNHEAEWVEALFQDLGRPEFESLVAEIDPCLAEIEHLLLNFESWAEEYRVGKPLGLAHFNSQCSIRPEALGLCLIISPWNFPLSLALNPLAAAIAGGNRAILKPSELSNSVSHLLAKLIPQYVSTEICRVELGGADAAQSLLNEKFDFIFFTGSPRVGKIVMQKAAETLTPVALELGGKSPVVFDEPRFFSTAVKRLLWGKFLNAGQICVAPDHVYVSEKNVERFITEATAYLKKAYPQNSKACLGKIVNSAHFHRLQSLLEHQQILAGGEVFEKELKIQPTLVKNPSPHSLLMQEEIFGPILPIIPYCDLDQVITEIRSRPKPLSIYVFSSNKSFIENIKQRTSSGFFVSNDCLLQFSSPYLPAGGVGQSGMGRYHGHKGFELFSNLKSVEQTRLWPDLAFRYPPYKVNKKSLLRRIL